jgi:lipopolysaccharide export system permease protein
MAIFQIRILDRYLFLGYLKTFFFIVLNLTVIICIIDLVEKNADFIRNKPGYGEIFLDYYANFIPYIANLLSPISTFITTIFFISRLAQRTEIIAIFSSGISFFRFMLPIWVAASCLGIGCYFLIGYFIPDANKGRLAFEYKYVNSPFKFQGRNIHLKIGPRTYFYIQSYNSENHEGFQCTLEDIERTKLNKKISAKSIRWLEDKKKWRLSAARILDFTTNPNEFKWIETVDTSLALSKEDFENQHLLNERLNNTELDAYIENQKQRGADNLATFEVERYLRLTYPFSFIILSTIGAVLSARKSRTGSGGKVALGFVLAFIYIVFHIVSRTLAQSGGLHPLLACWMPNLVFAIVGLILYKNLPR